MTTDIRIIALLGRLSALQQMMIHVVLSVVKHGRQLQLGLATLSKGIQYLLGDFSMLAVW